MTGLELAMSEWLTSVLSGALLSFLLVIGLIAALIPLAHRVNLIDIPRGHKTHLQPTPLVGGIAIYGALLILVFFNGVWPDLSGYQNLVLIAFCLLLFGVIDDRRHLPVKVRFVSQIAVATTVCLVTDIRIDDLGDLTGTGVVLQLGSMAVPFTVFALVGAMNACNMVDGVDGLAGSLVFVILGALAIIAGLSANYIAMAMLVILMAAIAGFLVYNLRLPGRQNAHVFLGDAGSMLLGLLIGCFLVSFTRGDQRLMPPVTALWVFALPLLDIFVVMLRRYQAGVSIFRPARDHFHHRLQQYGFSVGQTTAILAGLQLLFALVGIAGTYFEVAEAAMFYLALLAYVLVLMLPQLRPKVAWLISSSRVIK